jgi:hypothetical protein
MKRYTTYGPVRGLGPVRTSRWRAESDLGSDRAGCRLQGGYSDRCIYDVDSEGFLRDSDGELVWAPGGRSQGAIKVA